MHPEIERIAESLARLAAGAKSIVTRVPIELEAEFTRRVIERPHYYLIATKALSYALTSCFCPTNPVSRTCPIAKLRERSETVRFPSSIEKINYAKRALVTVPARQALLQPCDVLN